MRTEKKAVKRLVALAEENREMELSILHTNAPEKAEDFKRQLEDRELAFQQWYPYVL